MLRGAVSPHVQERIEYDAYGQPKLRLGADFNHDGQINFFDISAFLEMYNSRAYGSKLFGGQIVQGAVGSVSIV